MTETTTNMMVAFATPSRGLIFSKTTQSIIEGMQALNKLGIATMYVTSHDLPIPDGHNYCTETALANPSVDRILFIEEDMYLFPDAIVSLVTTEAEMATLQYNDKNGRPKGIIEFGNDGEVVWCGLGATLIKRSVFDKVGKPYFFTERRWSNKRRTEHGKLIKWYEPVETPGPYQYGGLDVDFCMRVNKAGIKIKCIQEHKAHHFQLIELGQPHVNQGMHNIRQV